MSSKPKTKDIKLLGEHHTHAGRDYGKDDIIRDMDADSADYLISIGKAEEAPASTTKKEK